MKTLLSALLCLSVTVLLRPDFACAGEPLSDRSVASFTVAIEPDYRLAPMGSTGEPALPFGAVLPQNARDLQVLYVYTPDNAVQLKFGVAQIESTDSAGQAFRRGFVALDSGSGPAVLPVDAAAATGPLAGLFVWSPGDPLTTGTVLLLTFSSSVPDAPIVGLHVSPDGRVSSIAMAGAKALHGQLSVQDLDDDGVYELITHRSLDGFENGFTYRAVRAFDPQSLSYGPSPEKYKGFYEQEIAFLDWVLETREKIMVDAMQYMSTEDTGMYFSARRDGRVYSFDSVITLPDIPDAGGNIAAYNIQRENALKKIREYRDELKGWIGGGSYPEAWQMGSR